MSEEKENLRLFIEFGKRGQVHQMSEFLAEKVPINGTDSLGLTALHWAASGGHDEACEWLVQQGANVNAQAKDGDTPLFKAAWRGHPSTCSVLIAQGADRRILNKEGKGAYDLAKTPAIKRVCTPLPELGILTFYFYFCCMFAIFIVIVFVLICEGVNDLFLIPILQILFAILAVRFNIFPLIQVLQQILCKKLWKRPWLWRHQGQKSRMFLMRNYLTPKGAMTKGSTLL